MLRRKLALCLPLLLPCASLSVHAQNIAGQWQGTLQTRHPLRMVLKVIKSADGLKAFLVSVDQSPRWIPVTKISITHRELEFSVARGNYHGKLSDDGSRIDGSWIQQSSIPLNFERATEATSWLTKSKTRMIAVAPGVSLEVLDWGGSGPPLVFLAGLGDTAHIFDDFAPKFVPEYHVYGITRRGFGASSSPAPNGSNYSADQLGDDVLKVIDALRLKKPVLIGHSIAGEVLSSIGSRFPERVAGLIYLDAGYAYALYSQDSADRAQDCCTLDTQLDAQGLQSDLNTYLAGGAGMGQKGIDSKMLGDLRLLEKDLEADGKMAELLPSLFHSGTTREPPDAAPAAAIVKGEQKYTNIRVPILAIFASPHLEPLPPMAADKKAELIALDQANSASQAKAFEKLNSAKVVIIPNANHYVFLSNEQEVEKDIKDFLTTRNLIRELNNRKSDQH